MYLLINLQVTIKINISIISLIIMWWYILFYLTAFKLDLLYLQPSCLILNHRL